MTSLKSWRRFPEREPTDPLPDGYELSDGETVSSEDLCHYRSKKIVDKAKLFRKEPRLRGRNKCRRCFYPGVYEFWHSSKAKPPIEDEFACLQNKCKEMGEDWSNRENEVPAEFYPVFKMPARTVFDNVRRFLAHCEAVPRPMSYTTDDLDCAPWLFRANRERLNEFVNAPKMVEKRTLPRTFYAVPVTEVRSMEDHVWKMARCVEPDKKFKTGLLDGVVISAEYGPRLVYLALERRRDERCLELSQLYAKWYDHYGQNHRWEANTRNSQYKYCVVMRRLLSDGAEGCDKVSFRRSIVRVEVNRRTGKHACYDVDYGTVSLLSQLEMQFCCVVPSDCFALRQLRLGQTPPLVVRAQLDHEPSLDEWNLFLVRNRERRSVYCTSVGTRIIMLGTVRELYPTDLKDYFCEYIYCNGACVIAEEKRTRRREKSALARSLSSALEKGFGVPLVVRPCDQPVYSKPPAVEVEERDCYWRRAPSPSPEKRMENVLDAPPAKQYEELNGIWRSSSSLLSNQQLQEQPKPFATECGEKSDKPKRTFERFCAEMNAAATVPVAPESVGISRGGIESIAPPSSIQNLTIAIPTAKKVEKEDWSPSTAKAQPLGMKSLAHLTLRPQLSTLNLNNHGSSTLNQFATASTGRNTSFIQQLNFARGDALQKKKAVAFGPSKLPSQPYRQSSSHLSAHGDSNTSTIRSPSSLANMPKLQFSFEDHPNRETTAPLPNCAPMLVVKGTDYDEPESWEVRAPRR